VILRRGTQVDGNIVARSDVELWPESFVGGHVTATGSVSVDPSAVVSGTVSQGADLPPIPPITPVSFTVQAGEQDVWVAPDAVRTLDPGSYGRLTVREGGTLRLRAGHYIFERIQVEQGSRIEFDLGAGATVVDVAESAVFSDEVVMAINSQVGDAAGILFRVAGDEVNLRKGGTYLGTYLAPNAYVHLGQDTALTGALYGRWVKVKHRARVIGKPAREVFASLFVNPEIVYRPPLAPEAVVAHKVAAPGLDLAGAYFVR
jgi:hypothetical protein